MHRMSQIVQAASTSAQPILLFKTGMPAGTKASIVTRQAATDANYRDIRLKAQQAWLNPATRNIGANTEMRTQNISNVILMTTGAQYVNYLHAIAIAFCANNLSTNKFLGVASS